jgi:hypothetical protein
MNASELATSSAPFTTGDRVVRRNDPLGTLGTVERVSLYGIPGEPTWAVAVRTDEDGEVWSGTQETPDEGAWILRDAAEASGLRPEGHPWEDFPAAVAAHERKVAQAAELPQLPTLPKLRAAVERRDSWCTFSECIHHLKPLPVEPLAALPIDEVATAIAGLTPAGREFMAAVGMKRFDFFDEGINEGSGNWGENMSWQFASMTDRKPRSVSGIMSRLSVTGLWGLSDGDPDQGKWWYLTELGAAVARKLAEVSK